MLFIYTVLVRFPPYSRKCASCALLNCYTHKEVMRILIAMILLVLSPITLACADEVRTNHTPFAKLNGSDRYMRHFELFAPKMLGEFYLTSIYLYQKNQLHVSLSFKDAFTYPDHNEAYISLNQESLDAYEIYLNYSTTEDGALVMCGGNIIKKSINDLLNAKKPKEVVPLPPKPQPER